MKVEGQEVLLCSSPPPLSTTKSWWSSETVAVVTGGNKGIGFSLVKRFAELGLSVVLTSRDTGRGHKALDLLRSQGHCLLNHVYFYQLDISKPSSITRFTSWFKQKFQALDILVNNAGVSFNEIHENSVENAETVIKTNFYGSKMLTEALLPFFRLSSPSFSRILNISSRLGSINKIRNPKLKEMLQSDNLTIHEVEGMVKLFLENVMDGTWKHKGWPEIWPDYAVSKMALNGYSRVLAKLYKDNGLFVNCFCPGFTQTSMTGGKGTHTADDAAVVAASLALLAPKYLQTGRFYIGFHRPRGKL